MARLFNCSHIIYYLLSFIDLDMKNMNSSVDTDLRTSKAMSIPIFSKSFFFIGYSIIGHMISAVIT